MPNFGLVDFPPSYVCDMYVSLGEGRRHPGLSPALLMSSVGSASPVGLGLRLGALGCPNRGFKSGCSSSPPPFSLRELGCYYSLPDNYLRQVAST